VLIHSEQSNSLGRIFTVCQKPPFMRDQADGQPKRGVRNAGVRGLDDSPNNRNDAGIPVNARGIQNFCPPHPSRSASARCASPMAALAFVRSICFCKLVFEIAHFEIPNEEAQLNW
jgi:hypothetical protein